MRKRDKWNAMSSADKWKEILNRQRILRELFNRYSEPDTAFEELSLDDIFPLVQSSHDLARHIGELYDAELTKQAEEKYGTNKRVA